MSIYYTTDVYVIISCLNILADFGESTNRSIIQNSKCIKNNELNSSYYIFLNQHFWHNHCGLSNVRW